MTEPVSPIEISAPLHVSAGEIGTVNIRVTNPLPVACDFIVGAVGLDPSWSGQPVGCGPVGPGATASVDLTFRIPTGSPAGTFPFLISVQSLDVATGAAIAPALTADCTLVLGDGSQIGLSLEPGEPTAVGTRRFRIVVENRSTEPLSVEIGTQPSRGLVLSTRRDTVKLGPGQTERVRARALAGRRLTGQSRRFPFVVTAQARSTPVRLDGVFVARPLFGTAFTKVMAVLVIVAVWATIAIVALDRVSSHAHRHATELSVAGPASTSITGSPGSSSNGSGAKGGGGSNGGGASGGNSRSGGSKSGSGSSGKSSSKATVVSGDRLDGVISSPDPGNVTVTLQPVSLDADQTVAMGSTTPPQPMAKISDVAYETPEVVSNIRSTTTTAAGEWQFAAVTNDGYYLLTFSKPGFQTVKQIVTKSASAMQPLTVDMSSGAGSLSGRVTDSNGAVKGATVTIADGDTTITTATPTKGTSGTWSVGGLTTPDSYLVTVTAPGLGATSRVETLAAGHSASHVDLVMKRGVESLSGTVRELDALGNAQPDGGVTVTVSHGSMVRTVSTLSAVNSSTPGSSGGSSPGASTVADFAADTATDPDAGDSGNLTGVFDVPDLPVPARYTVTYSQAGYSTQTQQIKLTGSRSQQTLSPPKLMPSGASVSGKVVSSGTSSSGAPIGIVLANSQHTYKSTTGSNNKFLIEGIAPGNYVLTAEEFGMTQRYVSITAKAGKEFTLPKTLILTPVSGGLLPKSAHIYGRVVDAETSAVLTCLDSSGNTLTGSQQKGCIQERVLGTKLTTASEPSTQYVLPADDKSTPYDGLAAGVYNVEVSSTGYVSSTIKVQVSESDVVEAPTVALYPDSSIAGTITSGVAGGTVPNNTCVFAVPGDDTTAAPPTCDGSGTCVAPTGGGCDVVNADPAKAPAEQLDTYNIADLADGDYEVSVVPSDPDWETIGDTVVNVALGQSKRYDATLNRQGEIHILATLPTSDNDLTAPTSNVAVSLYNETDPGTALSLSASQVSQTTPGDITIDDLADGDYDVCVTTGGTCKPPSGNTGEAVGVEVSEDQTVDQSIVMTATQQDVVGRVVYEIDNTEVPVKGATVTVNGVGSYNGSTPVPATAQLTTGSDGCFAVTTDGSQPTTAPGCGTLTLGTSLIKQPLAANAVTVDVDGTNIGFPAKLVQSTSADGTEITYILQPNPRLVSGTLQVDDQTSSSLVPPVDLSAAKITVVSAAPGAGSVVVKSATNGTLTWTDSALGNVTDEIRPGTYTLQASFPGYDDATSTFTCGFDPAGTSAMACDVGKLSLDSHESLAVTVIDPMGNPVDGAAVTLSGGDATTTTVVAAPNDNAVTFPGLSEAAGTYNIAATAAGYHSSGVNAVKITSGQPATLKVTLNPAGSIYGTVQGAIDAPDSSSVPLSGVTVTATNGTDTFTALTASNGTYTIIGTVTKEGLDQGNWTVSTGAVPGYTDMGGGETSVMVMDGDATEADLSLVANDVPLNVTLTDDSAGSPSVNDAKVVVADLNGNQTTLTGNGSGTYSDTLPPTTYSITITAPGHSPLSGTLVLPPGSAAVTVPLVLATRADGITVHVLGQTGTNTPAALSGATVTITPQSTGQSATGTTDSNGNYQSPALTDDTYTVAITDTGYGEIDQTVTLANGQLLSIDATLEQALAQVTVNVTSSSGDSMSGALVTLAAADSSARSQPAQEVDSSGATTFNGVVPGTYTATSTGPGQHLAGSSASFTVAGGDTDTEAITVAENKLSLSLTTSDSSSTSATVTINPQGAGSNISDTVQTDGTTPLVIFVPSGQDYTLTVSAPGYETQTQTLTDASTTLSVKLEVVQLDVSVTLDGNPAANAAVTVSTVNQPFTTGPNGNTVKIGGLTSGDTYTVAATLTNGSTEQKTVSISSGSVSSLAFAFTTSTPPAGNLAVKVTQGGSQVSGASVTVSGVAHSCTTDGTNPCDFNGLDPGQYTVQVTPPGSNTVLSQTATVTNGTTTAVTVDIPAASSTASLAVTLTGTGNLTGATVTVSNDSASVTGTTDSTGKVTLTGLPTGTYTVSAKTTDGGSGSTSSALSAGANSVSLPVTYQGTLTVTVQDAGVAVSGATVTVVSGGTTKSGTSAADGTITFNGLPPGSYTVKATKGSGMTMVSGSTTASVVGGGSASVTVSVS